MTAPDQANPLNQTQPAPETVPPAKDSATADAQNGSDVAEQLAAAQKSLAEAQDRYLRLAADMENLRRRTVREKDEIRLYAAGRLLEDMLPVLDSLGLGLTAAKAPNADLMGLVSGMTMVADQLKNVLGQHGLKEINPAKEVFDPNQHEAIASQPHAEIAEGSVIQVVRIGYSLNGRVLRPASVIVSSGPAAEAKK